jgi:hypothetical protein
MTKTIEWRVTSATKLPAGPSDGPQFEVPEDATVMGFRMVEQQTGLALAGVSVIIVCDYYVEVPVDPPTEGTP